MLRTQRLLLIKPQEHPTDKSKELLSALLTPHVIEFIDLRKLAFPSLILDLATNAALHAIQHGDTGYIDKILEIFKGSQYTTQMKSWFGFRTGLEIQEVLGQHLFTSTGMPPNLQVQFQMFLKAKPARQATKKHAKQATQITAKLTTKKPNKKAKRVDMLDSWARLPGSFGAGNRG